MIKDFQEGTKINQSFLVVNMSKALASNSDPYLNLTLQDKSGVIEARKWSCSKQDEEIFTAGSIVQVQGDILCYKGEMQIKVISGTALDINSIDLYDYLSEPPVSKQELQNTFTKYLGEIKNKDIKDVVSTIFQTKFLQFCIYPAASKNHHEYVSGLLHHTVTMLKLADSVCNIYQDVNKDYLYAGIMLHDVGKIEELSGPALPRYTDKGKLIGHISLEAAEISEVCNKLSTPEEIKMVLTHLILSHHGNKEFGSPVEPMTKEAEILHHIDDLDAKLNMIDKALKEVEEGEFTQRVNALDSRSFYKCKKI